MALPPPGVEIEVPLLGIGIDVCDGQRFIGVRERWGGRVDRVFSQAELSQFPGESLGWCWAARESIVKALSARMLGSPLAEMIVAASQPQYVPQLHYRPGPKARDQLERLGVSRIMLHTTRLAGCQCVIALAVASSPPFDTPWHLSWGALPFVGRPEGSAQARRAGLVALRPLVGPAQAHAAQWSGGHGGPPFVTLADSRPSLASLSHDGGIAAAVVAVSVGGGRS